MSRLAVCIKINWTMYFVSLVLGIK